MFINLTSPESRGAAIALLNFVNCLGRGCGPTVVEAWMEYQHLNRRQAMGQMLNLWLLAGALLCVASFTIVQDEERLKNNMLKFAEDSMKVYNSTKSTITPTAIATALLQQDISVIDVGGMEAGHNTQNETFSNTNILEVDRDK